jgi:hypothetical protein
MAENLIAIVRSATAPFFISFPNLLRAISAPTYPNLGQGVFGSTSLHEKAAKLPALCGAQGLSTPQSAEQLLAA